MTPKQWVFCTSYLALCDALLVRPMRAVLAGMVHATANPAIGQSTCRQHKPQEADRCMSPRRALHDPTHECRSEEHTSELQSRGHLVCSYLLEKKKIPNNKK